MAERRELCTRTPLALEAITIPDLMLAARLARLGAMPVRPQTRSSLPAPVQHIPIHTMTLQPWVPPPVLSIAVSAPRVARRDEKAPLQTATRSRIATLPAACVLGAASGVSMSLSRSLRGLRRRRRRRYIRRLCCRAEGRLISVMGLFMRRKALLECGLLGCGGFAGSVSLLGSFLGFGLDGMMAFIVDIHPSKSCMMLACGWRLQF